MKDREWANLVAKQRGAFSLTQARASGRNSSMLTRSVTAGRVRRGLPGVYLVVGTPRTRSQRAHEALLWAGPDAALSHETAGALLGLDIASDRQIHVTTTRNLRPPDGSIRVHRRALPARDVTRRHDLRTTTMPRTIIDLAGALCEEALDIALDSAIRRGMRWHDGRAAFENDRRRASELASLGWRVLQITWLQLKYEPAAVAARIDRALRTPAISALRS